MSHEEASLQPLLAVIPCRGGSKGLLKKSLRPLAGIPLLAHSILFARQCSEISRCIISTDSQEIAATARKYGGDVPFLRPAELARDDTPMWPVLQHALKEIESLDGCRYGSVLLLSPPSPGRLPQDVTKAIDVLLQDSQAVGVVAVSKPSFNPRWVCVDQESDGYMRQSFPDGNLYTRRQDVPAVYRINGALYLWRRGYVANSDAPRYFEMPHRMLEIAEERAIDIDNERDLHLAELMLREEFVCFPWLSKQETE